MIHQIYDDLSFGITTIDTGLVRPGFDASHLIVDNGEAAFVDVGPASTHQRLLETLHDKQIAPEQVRYLLVTHVHLDHAGAAGTLLPHFPNAQVVVHPKGARHLIAPERLLSGATAVYGAERLRSLFGEMLPIPPERIFESSDGMTLPLGTRQLLIHHTNGHARHHYCVIDECSQGIFTGDTFGVSYRDFDTALGQFIFPATTPVQFEPDEMHAAIERLLAYQPQCLYLAHFGRVTDVPRLAEELHRRIDLFVALAHGIQCAQEERSQALTQQMEHLLINQLKAHGCTLEEPRLRTLLLPDVALNVMGLEVWLDRMAGKNKE